MAKKNTRLKAIDPIAVFKLLADANRYRALMHLAGARKGLLVGEIAEALGMEHSATSHLLGLLNESGVVSYRKEGRTVRYTLSETPLARMLVRVMRSF
jgi:DNA-binding transcriptional ArsR family regulator